MTEMQERATQLIEIEQNPIPYIIAIEFILTAAIEEGDSKGAFLVGRTIEEFEGILKRLKDLHTASAEEGIS